MKKTFRLRDLDCANCAAKMENAINKLDGVQSATVSFMTQRLTLEADDARFDEVLKEAVRVCRKVAPDCTVLVLVPSPPTQIFFWWSATCPKKNDGPWAV